MEVLWVGIPVVVIIVAHFVIAGYRPAVYDPKTRVPHGIGHVKRLLILSGSRTSVYRQ